uniref:Uncharacterized protein n=1 Tax=Opuntia streptacantha TaxID=393608 RepID=A0A7C9DTE4_OPUST
MVNGNAVRSSHMSRYIIILKSKNQKTHKGKRKAAKQNSKSGEAGDARPCHPGRTTVRLPPRTVVNTTGSPWWLLPGPVPTLLERCVLVHFWSTGFCHGSSVLGLLGFFY